MSNHKFKPEATNAGHYFSDCSCGWSGGVYPSRTDAKEAWRAHVDVTTPPEPVKPVLLIGKSARGQETSA